MLLKITKFIVLAAFIAFTTACQKDEDSKKPKKASITESKLYKINRSAALIKLSIDTSKNINCKLATIAEGKSIQNQDSKSGSLLKSMRDENQNLCNFYTDALKIVSPVFEAIENSGFIPKESFILTIISYSYDKENKRIYEEDIIGLFRSLDNCEAAKSLAQKVNIPNKGCKKWDEKEF
jgi:hypothetical protein